MKELFIFFTVYLFFSAQIFAQEIEKQNLDRNGNPTFVKFDTKFKSVSKDETKTVLVNLLNMNENGEYKPLRSETDQIGYVHERFQQYYKGIKVENGVYVAHSRNNILESLSGEYKLINEINIAPSLSAENAVAKARAFVNAQEYMEENQIAISAPELVIVTNDYGKHPKDAHEMVLAYKVDVYATKPLSRDYIYVNAQTGEIVHTNAIIKSASGSAATRYSGTKTISTESYSGSYRLRDVTRGGGINTYDCNTSTSYTNAVDFTDIDNNWTVAEWNNAAKDNGALDAHWAGMMTYDYFKDVHGRNSFDGNGAAIKMYVHYASNYENAFWNGSVFTFGDGASTFDILTSLDVVGHEFGHAVCSYTANLIYSDEPGALNEAFSDIWGCTIENRYAPEKSNWLMGEDIGYVLRSLSDPKSRGLPDTYLGDYWVTTSADYYGVHTNNGPFCYWYYLISVGGSGTNDNNDAYNVTAIGIAKAEKIAYRVESVYMTASSNYANARTFAIQSAIDLYGAGSPEEISVTNAMYAVGVGGVYGAPEAPSAYCVSKGRDYSFEWMASFKFGTYTKTSAGSSYSDYTATAIPVTGGQTYAITLTPAYASASYSEYWKIWIDYNNDTIFDVNELVYDAGALSSVAVSGNITIPTGTSGLRRMRVSMKYNSAQTPCETFDFGEVEDYSVNISQSSSDTQAPTAPTNLVASNVAPTTLTLGWTASTDNVGVTAYDIYKNGALLATIASTSYNVSVLTASTAYSFYVKAKDAAGNVSAASSTINVTTTAAAADTQVPTAPTNLAASNVAQTTLTLGWTASTDNVGVTAYDVYKNGALLASTASTSYNVTGLTAATAYSFYVKAKDAAGNVSVASSTINVTTAAAADTQAPTAPTDLTSSIVAQTTLTLGLTASTDNVGVTAYDVYKNGALLATTASTSYNVTGLTSSTDYSFYAKAKDAAGNVSSASNTVNVTTTASTLSYCTSKGNNVTYEWISKVVVGAFTNSSAAAGYTDFTGQTITLDAGTTVSISLTPGFGGSAYNEYWKIWIDYNGDKDFDDANELAFDAGAVSKLVKTGSINILSTASGTTRMRVSMKYNSAQTACEAFSYGEVEDYTVTFGTPAPDTQAPTAPTNLAASSVASTTLSLGWTASTDNVGVTAYDVYKNGVLFASTASASYNVSGLTASTAYSFYVKAKDAAGNISAASSTINVTTTAAGDTQAPTVPSNLAATSVAQTTLSLGWTASTDNVGVTAYDVYKNGVLLASTASTSYNVSGLTAATAYTFYVKAKDAAGNISAASTTINVTSASSSDSYCTSKGNNTTYEWIDLVQLNEINNVTSVNGYGDFTNLTASVARGSSQTIYFSCGFKSSAYTEFWVVWIDWNQNGIFDANEKMVTGSSTSSATLSGAFTVPTDAVLGTTRMRVSMKYNVAPTACETFSYGEVEDYTINVNLSGFNAFSGESIDAEVLGNEMATEILVYPNPASVFINVSLNNGSALGTVKIYNMTSTLVKIVEMDDGVREINISDLPVGWYLISIEGERDPMVKWFIKE